MNKLKMCSALIILLLLWKQDLSECVRILELRVPEYAVEGGEALLGCQFDMEGDHLYSVKWYKDDREFYRYVPTNSEPTSYFSIPGVFVDVARSSSTVVALEYLTKESGGRYRCEVSGETPYFVTAADEKDVRIYLIPNNRPRLSGVKHEYELGEHLRINCTSSRSRPKSQIRWLVNNQSAPERYVTRSWEWRAKERSDALVTTQELAFVLKPHHFRDGVLTIECQAVLAPLYHDKVIRHILRVDKAIIEESSEPIQHVFEASVFSASSDLPEAEPQNKEIIGNGITSSKHSTWAILTTIFLLQILF